MRHDALVYSRIDEIMGEHEWVPLTDIAMEDVNLEMVNSSIDRMSSELVRVGSEGVTFTHVWETSRRVASAMREMASNRLASHLSTSIETLTDEQKTVRESVLSGSRITLCCSPAGTGKTHTAASIASEDLFVEPFTQDTEERDASEDPGRVLCVAPTHKALAVLRSKISGDHVTFSTVQRLSATPSPPRARLLIVDETSMLTMRHIHFLLTTYGETNTRILFLGDDVQLPCIGRGLPIRDMQGNVPTHRLTKCHRTEGVGLLEAAQSIRSHGTLPPNCSDVMVNSLTNADAITSEVLRIAMNAATNEGLLETGRVIPPWDPSYVQIITAQNKHVTELNRAIQSQLTNVNERGRSFSDCFQGDAVRFIVNTDRYKNGDEGIIDRVYEKRGSGGFVKRYATVRRSNGESVEVDNGGHLAPAYAGTVHKAQGSEYSTVILAIYPQTYPKMITREMVYTSITRARKHLHIVGYTPFLDNLSHVFRRTVFPFVSS
jgi:exodeoxyribonuclease V alpha subunit